MRKTIVAGLVLAGVTGAVHAQSNVTVYGILDLGYTYSKASGGDSRNAIDSGNSAGSRLGFQGTEDLGNGLKAGFRYEAEIFADRSTTASGAWGQARASWINLAGSFGELRVGRQDGLGFGWLSSVSPFGTTHGQASMNNLFGYSQVGNRLSNSVFYYSPNLSGFDAAVGYTNSHTDDESVGNDADQRAFNVGLRYKKGPVLAVLVYEQRSFANNVSADGRNNTKSIAVGGTYDFGVVKVHAAYGQLHNYGFDRLTTPAPIHSAKTEKAWLLGLSAPVGKSGSVFGTYQQNKGRNENLYGANEDDATRGFALGYTHALSKRTNLYVYASRYNDVFSTLTSTGGGVTPVTGAPLGHQNQFGSGIVHRF